MRYYLIGGDGREYGPVDAPTLKTWIDSNRADARSRVRVEGSSEWKTVADFPELAEGVIFPPEGETAASPVPIEFRGEWKEFFRIWIVNLLLTVATLGIYAAWAKVRTRRYFYANTRLFGHSFDYLADPRRILIGNLIVAVLFFLYATSQLVSPVLTVVALVVFALLMPWFIVRGAVFNARNTSWRGLRFGFNGHYGRAFLLFLLAPLGLYPTLGLLFPAWEKWRREFIVNSHTYGTTPFSLNLAAGKLYKWFFVIVGGVLVSAIGVGLCIAIVVAISQAGMQASGAVAGADGANFPILLGSMTVILIYALQFGVVFGISAYWKSRVFTLAWNNTRLGPLVFHANMRCRDLFWLQIGNFLLMLVSLGLLYPLVKTRTLRFQLARVTVENHGDLDAFVASSRPAPGALGEAASDFWDFDIGFGL
jgi:uncharacterized membrane protein YjgN (DUF898 family)